MKTNFLVFILSGRLRQVLLYIKLNTIFLVQFAYPDLGRPYVGLNIMGPFSRGTAH